MKTSIILSTTITTLAAAAPLACGSTSTTTTTTTAPPAETTNAIVPFTIMSARSTTPIHLRQVNANGGKFWIGKDPATYCPEDVVPTCPAGIDTRLAGGHDTLSAWVQVTGGQQVYIDPSDGSLSLTGLHSSFPVGAIVEGFSKTESTNGASFGFLSWAPVDGSGSGGLVACQKPDEGASVYQVYAQVPGLDFSSCLGFNPLTVNSTNSDYGAYAYV